MNPIGLTQEEEASQQPAGSAPVAKARDGQPSCRITVPPEGEACGATVEWRIVWHDGEETLACANCVVRMRQLAESHRTVLRYKPLSR
jgi:hypothetical protein